MMSKRVLKRFNKRLPPTESMRVSVCEGMRVKKSPMEFRPSYSDTLAPSYSQTHSEFINTKCNRHSQLEIRDSNFHRCGPLESLSPIMDDGDVAIALLLMS